MQTGGAEYRERIPKGFTSLGNGVVNAISQTRGQLAENMLYSAEWFPFDLVFSPLSNP